MELTVVDIELPDLKSLAKGMKPGEYDTIG